MNRHSSFIKTATLVVFGVVAVMLISAPAAPAAGSVAKAKARLQAVEARLGSVSTQSEIAVEKYNQATSQLATVRAQIDENQKQLETARKNLELADQQLMKRAQNIYKSRDVGVVDVIFEADSFDELISQLDMMQRLGNSDVDTVHAIAAYKRDIKDRRLTLEADQKAAAKLVAAREDQKNQLIALQADLQGLTGKIKKEIKKLKYQAKLRAQLALTGYSGPIPGPVDPNSPGHPEIVVHRAALLRRPLRVGRRQPERLRLQRPHHVLLRADRHRPVARRHRPAARQHPGRPHRPAPGRPHLLRQRELQPPRGDLRQRHHLHRGAAHRRRGALRYLHGPRRLDRRPLLGAAFTDADGRRPGDIAAGPSSSSASVGGPHRQNRSFGGKLLRTSAEQGHGERTRATGAA